MSPRNLPSPDESGPHQRVFLLVPPKIHQDCGGNFFRSTIIWNAVEMMDGRTTTDGQVPEPVQLVIKQNHQEDTRTHEASFHDKANEIDGAAHLVCSGTRNILAVARPPIEEYQWMHLPCTKECASLERVVQVARKNTRQKSGRGPGESETPFATTFQNFPTVQKQRGRSRKGDSTKTSGARRDAKHVEFEISCQVLARDSHY